MNKSFRNSGQLFILIVVLIVIGYSQALGDWREERIKIDYLIDQVGKVEGVFIRNGTEHSPPEARDHLEYKLKRAINSWFAPDEEEWTARLFIDKVASKSSISGKPYKIRLNDGVEVKAADWLHERLKFFEQSSNGLVESESQN